MNRPPNVTSIDDLMDIDEIEYQQYKNNSQVLRGSSHPSYGNAYGNPDIGREDPNRYNKYIRNNSFNKLPDDAGMNFSNYNNPMVNSNMINSNMIQDTPEQNTMQYNIPFNQNNCIPNCIQIAEHIRDCPICCKFYKNDNTVYIIVIIVLAIMCLLLLKRVLDI
jgi:hypothetical protein